MYAKLYLDRGSSLPEGNCRNQAVTLKTPGPEHDECYRDFSPTVLSALRTISRESIVEK